MTTTLAIAHCPRCGTVDSIFIRDDDELVCFKNCREGRVDPPPTATCPLGWRPLSASPPGGCDTSWVVWTGSTLPALLSADPMSYCRALVSEQTICGNESIVGYGADPTPLCVEHFQQALRETRQLLDQLKEQPRRSLADLDMRDRGFGDLNTEAINQ